MENKFLGSKDNADGKAQGVVRVYVEKKDEYATEARVLLTEINELLRITTLGGIRVINRYDVEGAGEKLIQDCIWNVFAEPQIDTVHMELPDGYSRAFAVELLPGQYDQRADAAEQCIALVSQNHDEYIKPIVQTGKVYLLYGGVSDKDVAAIKKYIINPVECREATLDNYNTLITKNAEPEDIPVLRGFSSARDSKLSSYIKKYSLSMDINDIRCCRDYFAGEKRDPRLAELKVLETYWSDHCRHTTFLTEICGVEFRDKAVQKAYERYLDLRKEFYGDAEKTVPVTLMDMATIVAKSMRKKGLLPRLDVSEEVNACTVKIDVDIKDAKGARRKEPWLLLFKNETHNHPTEIEPFGGAATCVGGAIRDPLSGRGYVYQAMRLGGAADPRRPLRETIQGKLPQRKLAKTAAAGYSSYGNQIGVAAGLVDEIYHDGFAAKRMELGAVVAAVPEAYVRREQPSEGDVVILLGGRTGRDGCGGATGSSKAHTEKSLLVSGAEVQKGNAPEERKILRLFRSPEATGLIKRCNDFGAGGVSVAVGEIADGVSVNLDKIPTKYEGLNGAELAISESQERMALVVAESDAQRFIELAGAEDLEATVIGKVTKEPRLVMHWRGDTIVDISREFINTSGAAKHVESVIVDDKTDISLDAVSGDFVSRFRYLVSQLNVCSKRGLIEHFDSTAGAGTIFTPLGGGHQKTPIQAMAAKIPTVDAETNTASVMSWGYDPDLSSLSPFEGAYAAVVSSVAKLAATGAPLEQCYLSFQEYFGKLADPKRWGKPTAALLGALSAQLDLGIASIGGKDSMSGTFENLDVPPTLVSFAITVSDARELISPEFKKAGSQVVLLEPEYDGNLPKPDSFNKILREVRSLIRSGVAISAYAVTLGGIAEAIFKMCIGNEFGFMFADDIEHDSLFSRKYGAFVLELNKETKIDGAKQIGTTLWGDYEREALIVLRNDIIPLRELERTYDSVLEDVFPTHIPGGEEAISLFEFIFDEKRITAAPQFVSRKPRVLIPVFNGTNGEYESAAYAKKGGAEPEIFVMRTRTPSDLRESIKEFAALLSKSQILFIPGGSSCGAEPDGSGKFIANFLRNPYVADEINKLLNERSGLILGISDGFNALIKTGLVPYGKITDPATDAPTITHNRIGRHQSKIVSICVASDLSPWLAGTTPGDIFIMPMSSGSGRFVCSEKLLDELFSNGQIASQYVDYYGEPSMSPDANPAESYMAVEGITSPDGRVFGKMGHNERTSGNLRTNVNDMKLFESAVKYFRG